MNIAPKKILYLAKEAVGLKETMDKQFFMKEAIKEGKKALRYDEVPVGAVMVLDGEIIARAFNKKETKNNATAHAEIEVISKASKKLGNWYLEGVDMYVTLEPCAMCVGAMINARIKNLYFGARDTKSGCAGTRINLFEKGLFNHTVEVEGGILEKECGDMLTKFFRNKRKLAKDKIKKQ